MAYENLPLNSLSYTKKINKEGNMLLSTYTTVDLQADMYASNLEPEIKRDLTDNISNFIYNNFQSNITKTTQHMSINPKYELQLYIYPRESIDKLLNRIQPLVDQEVFTDILKTLKK